MPDAHYTAARESYGSCSVNTEAALATLAGTPISLHCWQDDDDSGFERTGRVVVPTDLWRTGPIMLKSSVELHPN